MGSFFSIAIPTYGYNGKGGDFIDFSLNIISKQTFNDYEVVISDHSTDETIKNICEKYSCKINIKYLTCEIGRGVTSPNINNAIRNCNGKWIKLLFQDDFLLGYDSLKELHASINENMSWVATSFVHSPDGTRLERPFLPTWNSEIWKGYNTIGCPSVIAFKNNSDVFFDDNLNWLMDVDFYKNLFNRYGEPSIINKILVVNRTWGNRLTDTMPQEIKDNELRYVIEKYK